MRTLSTTAFVALLAAFGSAQAQVQLNLTASRTSTTMPDGNIIPMWGWSCSTGTAAGSAFNGNATATATISPLGAITAVAVPAGDGGGGYTGTTTISVADTTGSGALLQATVSAGVITGVVVLNGGAGYTAPAFTVNSSVTPSTAASSTLWTSTLSLGVVTGFTVTNFGNGYATPPTVTLAGGGFTTAATPGLVTLTSTGVAGIAVGTAGAGYTSAPSVAISPASTTTAFATSEAGATCAQTNGQPQTVATTSTTGLTTSWQPPLITVPTGDTLTITLSNQLPVPTSLTIVGQMANPTPDVNGPGNPTRESGRPQHSTQTSTTWTALTVAGSSFVPPTQGKRAESFVQEACGVAVGTITANNTGSSCTTGAGSGGSITYTFTNLRPGTYLVESGSYPSIQGPMGLYGVLVVTTAPAPGTTFAPGTAYPSPCGATATTTCLTGGGVLYDADGVLLLSEIDAVQNAAADAAVQNAAFSPFNKWTPACSPLGSSDPLIASAVNTCYPAAVNYTPTYYLINGRGFDRTNAAANAISVGTTDATGNVLLRFVNAGLKMHMPSVLGLQMAEIADDSHLQPDVALAFTKATTPGTTCPSANPSIPLVAATATTQVAACPKFQNDFFMPAGKVLDIMVRPGACATGATNCTATTTYAPTPFPVFARDLALSTNSDERDGGMQAFVLINGGTAAVSTGGAGNPPAGTVTGYSGVGLTGYQVAVQANADVFILPANSLAPFTFNVLANDIGVANAIATGATNCTAVAGVQAAGQTNCLYLNGMYTFVPTVVNMSLSFSYCGNGATSGAACTTVNVNPATVGGAPHLGTAPSFYSAVNTLLSVSEPGVLALDTDPTGYRLYASTSNSTTAAAAGPGAAPQSPAIGVAAPANVVEGSATVLGGGCTVTLLSNGSFVAQSPANAAGNTCTFQYYAVNSQGTVNTTAQTVTLYFPPPTGVNVQVVDGVNPTQAITDYKWVIEQDLTFLIDPACQTNNGNGAAGGTNTGGTGTVPTGSNGLPCPTGGANHVPPTLGTNFHTSYMPVIASGCTGAQSCERGQSVYNPATGAHVLAACNHGVCLPSTTGLPVSWPKDVQLNALDPNGNPARYYISILPGDAANPVNAGYAGNVTAACQATGSGTTPTGQSVASCGHTMGGAPIPATLATSCATGSTLTANGRTCTYPNGTLAAAAGGNPLPGSPNYPITIPVQPNPLLTAQLSIFVFEDDAPLNGEHDVGGNNNEPGLGGFQVELWDEMAQSGDFTGQMTYDAYNEPLTNYLNGLIDPLTGLDACPVAATAPGNTYNTSTGTYTSGTGAPNSVASGMIIICPQYESDGVTPSPLVGNALVKYLMPGRFGVVVHPSAAREAAGEVWYQTNTLDGTHFLDSFVKVGEPAYFQEYGPGGWHVTMGMANPAVINGRLSAFCNGTGLGQTAVNAGYCGNTVKGQVTNLHENRAPDETLYDSGVFAGPSAGAPGDPRNYAAFAHTQCWASLGDPDGLTFAFTVCDANGNFTFTGIPDGNWALVVGDVWNDLIIDGSSKPVNLCSGPTCTAAPTQPTFYVDFPTFSWQTHVWTNAFMDLNGNGIQDSPATEPGLIQVPMRIRFRNGRFNNTQFTDSTGHANFNETFPLFNWYVVESDDTRFKNTGVHVVYDFGGQIDGPAGTTCLGAASLGSSNQANSAGSPCGNGNTANGTGTGNPYQGILNSLEPPAVSLPTTLLYPGAYYCKYADCSELNNVSGFPAAGRPTANTQTINGATYNSTGRVDPGSVVMEGVQGFLSQTEVLEWGKLPYLPGENGGIRGDVVYASTRPFDDPTINVQNIWEPLVPGVVINLYAETPAPDGTTLLKLVDSTMTSSWDKWAQGHNTTTNVPFLNCPGQPTSDPFFNITLFGTPNYLDPNFVLPNNSQYKCYDSMHNFNQVQPAPYDGVYFFPSAACSVAGTTTTGTTGTTYTPPTFTATVNGLAVTASCGEVVNPNYGKTGVYGSTPTILPPGKYIVEMVTPPGYEIVKEEDKNILIGDAFVSPGVINPQFVTITDIFIVPDQASINQNNINGVYNPSMYSGLGNPDYTGPITGTAPYTNCGTGVSCPPAGNNGNPTQTMGRDTFGGFNAGGLTALAAPCAGEQRIVPDFMSISPESGLVASFAGATRPLCDRKEVLLEDQMQFQTDFFLWTKTPAATHFTGFILDDFSSEFDQASPSFGEKFAVPNLPVSLKDFNGVEVERVYSDQWGLYNGLLFSTWEVNPPNPTGYSPGMYITEMNSPGPIAAPVCLTSPTPTVQGFPLGCVTNQTNPPTITVTDPYYNPGYSTFDYENPFMPQDTTYLDTPVIPLMAFAEAYNPPDCAYQDFTPAVSSVLGDSVPANAKAGTNGGAGPWVSGAGHTLTINALGDVIVPNYAYSGPAASTAPFNQRTITRHYGFGAERGSVSIGGRNASISGWTDMQIVVSVPSSLALCPMQQTPVPPATTLANGPAHCGQLVITTAGGQRSVDAVMVTYGGNTPTYISAEKLVPDTFGSTLPNALQAAVDAANPGDMIIVGPGTYTEMLQVWKPVQLQGVGAASTIINANTQPAGRLDPWRRRLDCMFGLGMNGQVMGATVNGGSANSFDPSGTYSCPFGSLSASNPLNTANPQAGGQAAVDPIQLEPVIGWDSNLNGNISELLQEPTLMGAYEGAAITELAKGIENYSFGDVGTTCDAEGNGGCIALNACAQYAWTNTTTAVVTCATTNTPPTGSTSALGDCNPGNTNFYPSNFLCNPSRVDGFTLTNSSQGGGALFVHGWNHNLEISNNRMTGNAGTLTGGITLGQPEVPDPTVGGAVCPALSTGSAAITITATDAAPLCIDTNVSMHNNAITFNSSYGDELNSNTPAAGGGVTVNTGSDRYTFQHNFVCGNLSSGDGGGMTHFGLSYYGDIEYNAFVFNQSTNPTLTTNGGGLIIEGNAPDGTFAENSQIDADAGPSLSDGVGPGTVVNANLIMGNTAESGEGGGLRVQSINGNDILNNPTDPSHWYAMLVTNNIIADNVAGWEGGGVSIQDAVLVTIQNNTIVSNDSTATAGVLFDTLGAQFANTPPPNCNPDTGVGCTAPVTTSTSQTAGLVTHPHSLLLSPAFTDRQVICPNFGNSVGGAGYVLGSTTTTPATVSTCALVSLPVLSNNIIFNNRPFYLTIPPGTTPGVAVWELTPPVSQCPSAAAGSACPPVSTNGVVTQGTGACGAGAAYWDLGVYGDTTIAGGNPAGYRMNPTYSMLTSNPGYDPTNFVAPTGGAGLFVSMYCNGSRVPPEIAPSLCAANPSAPPGTGPAQAPGCIYTGSVGITTPSGVPDNNPFYQPFTLTPAATVDEGNNWINMFYGPLSAVNPTIARGGAGYNSLLGNYSPASMSSPAVNAIPVSVPHPTTDFFGNPRPDTGAGGNGSAFDIGAVELGTGTAAPEAYTIVPNTGLRGTTVAVTIDGANLNAATGVTVSGNGITVTGFTHVGTTSVTVNFVISTTATLSARNVTLVAAAGAGNDVLAGAFTVVGPTLTSISPTTGTRGTTVAVTLTGTNLNGATAVTFSGGGVTCTGVANSTTTPATTVTANCAIAATANASARTVTVTTAAGVTNGVTFTIVAPATPALTGISPSSGVRGSGVAGSGVPAVAMTLTGTNLAGVSAVNVSGSGVACTVVAPAPSATNVNASCTITTTAALTARNVSVTVPGAPASNTETFTVTGATLASINPTSGERGTTFLMTLTGTNFPTTGTTTVTFNGGGVTASGVIVTSSTTITANVTVTSGAGLSTRNVTVTTPIGASTLPAAFTVVNPPAPTLVSISTASGRGTIAETLTGSNFVQGATVGVSGGGVTVSGVTVVNATTITATFNVSAGTGATARNVTVTTAGGAATLTGAFTP